MCQCTCHMDNAICCTDCAHLHSAEEQVMIRSTTEIEHICAVAVCGGSKDGLTAADHDVWYVRPVLSWRDQLRAMIVRSRLGDSRMDLRHRNGA